MMACWDSDSLSTASSNSDSGHGSCSTSSVQGFHGGSSAKSQTRAEAVEVGLMDLFGVQLEVGFHILLLKL